MKQKISILTLVFGLILLQSCYVGRYFYWNFADINDYKKFKSLPVEKGDRTFQFAIATTKSKLDTFDIISYNGKKMKFEDFLKASKTVAFLVIQNDTILYEKYFYSYKENSIVPSFSMAKSYVSALLGIAIQEGYIKSVHQPITDFIPELKDTLLKNVTLEHLLNMRSGIKYNESYVNPFGNVARAYYGRNLMKHIRKVKAGKKPDAEFEYLSINTQLLGIAIERATQRKLSEYLQEKIWKPIGAEYAASWSIDSKRNKTVKAFCCLNAVARDFAKFGRLYLHKGNWNGNQLISRDWVEQSTVITQDSKDFFYSYQWWHSVDYKVIKDSTKPDTSRIYRKYTRTLKGKRKDYYIYPGDDFMAAGILGQYIYVYPKKNLIIVRLGKKRGKVAWQSVFKEIARKL